MTQNKDIELPPLPTPDDSNGDKTIHYYDAATMQDYARQAITQNRQQRHLKEKAQLEAEWCMVKNLQINNQQQRGEPVGYITEKALNWLQEHGRDKTASSSVTIEKSTGFGATVPLYTSPQPANSGEPVAWLYEYQGQKHVIFHDPSEVEAYHGLSKSVPLYATPQPANSGEPVAEAEKRVSEFLDRRAQFKILDQEVIAALDGIEYELRSSDLRALITQPAKPVPNHLLERLKTHSEDKRNTAFSGSTMREALHYLSKVESAANKCPTYQGVGSELDEGEVSK